MTDHTDDAAQRGRILVDGDVLTTGGYREANAYPPRTDARSTTHGRRTKFTEEQLADALRKSAGIFAEACRILSATHGRSFAVSSLGRAVNASPYLQAVLDETVETRLDYAESQLWRRIESGCLSSMQFYLKCKGRHRGWHTAVTVSGDAANPIRQEIKLDLADVPVEKLREIQMALHTAREAAGRKALSDQNQSQQDE